MHWVHLVTGTLFCRETVRKVLRQLGHSWKKARKLLGKACPVRRAEFVEQLCQLLEQSKHPDSPLVLFCDEAHIHLDTDLGYGWAPVGKRLWVNSYSRSLGAKVTCFGFYALDHSEPVQIWPASWANGETTCQMLRRLRLTYPDRPLVLFWDNVSYHRALCVRELAAQLGIELRFLPPYSPDLMPVERLWSWLRQELTYLHCHVDFQQLTDRIEGLQCRLNDDPSAVHKRLRPKTHLDPEEEKLRFSA